MSENPFGDPELSPEEQKALEEMMKGEAASSPAPEPSSEPAKEPAATHKETLEVAAKEPAKEPEGEADAAVTIDEKGYARNAQGKFVPHKALHAEREEHKKTKTELQTAREERARLSERVEILLRAINGEEDQPAQQSTQQTQRQNGKAPAQFVDPSQDILGSIKQVQELLTQSQTQQTQERQQQQAWNTQVNLQNQLLRDASDYGKTNPQFQAAMQHVIQASHGMLELRGVADINERNVRIQNGILDFARDIYSRKGNVGEAMYKYAIGMGFKPQEAAVPQNGNGGQQQPATDKVTEKLDRVEAAMKGAGASLSNAAGSGGDSISANQILKMDEEEFATFVGKMGGMKSFEKRYLGV